MMIRDEGGGVPVGWIARRGSGLGGLDLFPACHECKQWRRVYSSAGSPEALPLFLIFSTCHVKYASSGWLARSAVTYGFLKVAASGASDPGRGVATPPTIIDSLSHSSREAAAHLFFFPSPTRKEFPQPEPKRHRR